MKVLFFIIIPIVAFGQIDNSPHLDNYILLTQANIPNDTICKDVYNDDGSIRIKYEMINDTLVRKDYEQNQIIIESQIVQLISMDTLSRYNETKQDFVLIFEYNLRDIPHGKFTEYRNSYVYTNSIKQQGQCNNGRKTDKWLTNVGHDQKIVSNYTNNGELSGENLEYLFNHKHKNYVMTLKGNYRLINEIDYTTTYPLNTKKSVRSGTWKYFDHKGKLIKKEKHIDYRR